MLFSINRVQCRALALVCWKLCACSAIYALTVTIATLMFQSSSNYYLLHAGNAVVVVFMNRERWRIVRYLFPLCAYAASFIALLFKTTAKHILIASAVNVVEQYLMNLIMSQTLPLIDQYMYRSIRFLKVLFFIALPFSFGMAMIGTICLHFSSADPFGSTLLTYTASHVSGNYLGLYTYYVLRGFDCRHWPARVYMRDLFIVCAIELLLNAWRNYGTFRQAATVQIYPLLAYIAASYDQCHTALADVLVAIIVIVAVVLKRGPYYANATANLSLFISLFIMLMYSAALTALLSFYMQQRRNALENVSRLKDELLLVSSQVSHDVRAPLTHVLSVCTTLQTAPYTPADLEEVNYSCQTIADIMDSWLIMLSESEKTTDINMKPRTKSSVIADTHNDLHMNTEMSLTLLLRKLVVYGRRMVNLSGKSITVQSIQPDNYSRLQFSNKMLQHVLINLVSNAIKYSNNGTISIDAQFDDVKETLCITVQDEGVGIAEDKLPHIFDQFYRIRADSLLNKVIVADELEHSFGVGLAIVNSLITKMRGTIAVKSHVGVGTTFQVTVPCRNVPCLETVDVENQIHSKSVLAGLHILVAEDNELFATMMQKQLAECACIVDIINDGALVVPAIASNNYDVLLLDGSLPHESGKEILYKMLHNKVESSTIPVIITISGGNDFLGIDWQPLIVEHLSKPFLKEELFAAIARACWKKEIQVS